MTDTFSNLSANEILDQVHSASSSIAEVIRDIPWPTHSVVVACLIGGIVLALFGRWSLRLALALLGLLLGVHAGLVLPAAMGATLSSPMTAGVGGIVGLLIGLIAYRFTIATAASVLGGVVATTMAAAFVQYAPEELPEVTRQVAPGAGSMTQSFDALREATSDESVRGLAEAALPRINEEIDKAGLSREAQHVRDFLRQVREVLGPRWGSLDLREKLIVSMATLMGLVGGFAGGLLLHKSIGSLVTAMAGAAMIIPAGTWLITASGAVSERAMPREPLVWVGLWLVLSAVAIAVQWRTKKPQADSE